MSEIARGETKAFILTVLNEDGGPADLAGAKIWWTVKHRDSDIIPTISKRNTEAGGDDTEIVIDTPSTLGRAFVYCVPTDTADVDHQKSYRLDVWVETTTQKRYQVIAPENFVITATVTSTF